MAGQRPRKGWIYTIDPYRVSLRCKDGHIHIYDLTEPGEVQCQTASCSLTMNSHRVMRGVHPYIVLTGEQFENDTKYSVRTFTAIPLTSQTTFTGLPTTYPIVPNSKNGLTKKSYALSNQLCSIDSNCFKDQNGDWLNRTGQLDPKDRKEIGERVRYYLDFSLDPTDDWFRQNASPELVKKIYEYLSDEEKLRLMDNMLDGL